MPTVYVSHSVSPSELGPVYALAHQLGYQGVEAVIAHRQWDPHGSFPNDLQGALNRAQAVVLFSTMDGHYGDWVNRELQVARGKPVIAVIEHGVVPQGITPDNIIYFSRGGDVTGTVEQVINRLRNLGLQKPTEDLLGALVVGGLILLLLAAFKED